MDLDFKKFTDYMQENDDYFQRIKDELALFDSDERTAFHEYLMHNFLDFDDGEPEYEDNLDGSSDDIDDGDYDYDYSVEDLINQLLLIPAYIYKEIFEVITEYEDGLDEFEDEMSEGASRIMKKDNMNRKKRKFMGNSKADLRKTKVKRKQAARKNKASKKRYYKANKNKIKNYQKQRSAAIKKGKHKVKLRRNA